MKRAVITGLGIVSSIGNNQQEVLASLREGRSGITFSQELKDSGMRSHVWGNVKLDTTGLIDRKVVRFMSDASIYAFLSMEQAIADAGLSPEAYQNNPRVGLIAGSGGGSPRFQVFGADAMRGPRGLKAVGPYVVTKAMASGVSACLATPFKIHGVNYSISSACATSAHCIGNAVEQIDPPLVGDELMNSTHHYEQLIEIFNSCFADDFNTRLIKGDDEPIYLPADAEVPYNRIVFAHGFYASAIHEISHWCIAGKARRELVDFGYWYCPDGRDAQTQSQFEDVEVKPQALDWLFCVAAGYPFNVSCDNLEGDFEPDRVVFQRRVHAQVMDYLTNGIPERPARFIKALQNYYHTPELTAEQFPWPEALN